MAAFLKTSKKLPHGLFIPHYVPSHRKQKFSIDLLSQEKKEIRSFRETCKPPRRLGCKLKRETSALPIEIFSMTAGESFKSDNEKVGNKGDEGKRGVKRGRALGYSAARSRKLATVPPATFVAYGDTNLALKIRPAFWR
ncbi:hypothetical protein K0M31_002354 [Melipona bicolor]|uniref:Uncharacterized protein n=1 Tax=Melipona bicolor TaxID=60889 RepID=A0AA40GIF5_9HYME|nr:hypothetical protein K0M31_002354 [Melipona bicolor]